MSRTPATSRRKYRLAVTVTFNRPLSKADAAKALAEKLARFGIGDNPVWPWNAEPDLYVDRLEVVDGGRPVIYSRTA